MIKPAGKKKKYQDNGGYSQGVGSGDLSHG